LNVIPIPKKIQVITTTFSKSKSMKKTASALVINAGSSSLKFAIYGIAAPMTLFLFGKIELIEKGNALFSYKLPESEMYTVCVDTSTLNDISLFLMDWIQVQHGFTNIKVVGHRIVHGMKHTEPQIITDQLIFDLKNISDYDPEHLPEELKLIEQIKKNFPDMQQVACFDTSFHTTMPDIAKLLPLPKRFTNKGLQRYGFHGISYAYLIKELAKQAGEEKAKGKVVLAQLGNGASLCAIRQGKSVDTTMGFTPSSGVPMSTRTGDLDAGAVCFLMQSERISPKEFNHLINHESGLLAISETSGDMRDLLKIQQTDDRAQQAIQFFCYQIKKAIGSFAAVLNGLETLVFSGGIGENEAAVRLQICEGLGFLGIEINKERNDKNEGIISTDKSRVCVRVINTNEELMIAIAVRDLLFPLKK
jgi:acetate kinase